MNLLIRAKTEISTAAWVIVCFLNIDGMCTRTPNLIALKLNGLYLIQAYFIEYTL